jgi:hypothetical protein
MRFALAVALLVACSTSSKEKTKMGMTDDHVRLLELEHQKGTMQYGQNLQVTPAPGADLVIASKDLIRFVGDKTDINALRIYLGPWQPRPDIPVAAIIASETYADPTPWAPPQPRTFDSFAPIPIFARVMWGAGGIQHTAYVDWPKRGLLLQVSGSYVQVNAFVNTETANAHVVSFEKTLPVLAATLGPEPGGGDAQNSATFTYPSQPTQDSGGGAQAFQNFQIPPFARAFTLVFDFPDFAAAGGSLVVATQELPVPIGTIGNNDIQIWGTPIGGTYDQDMFTVDPIPIAGQLAGNLHVEFTPGAVVGNVGCIFALDL